MSTTLFPERRAAFGSGAQFAKILSLGALAAIGSAHAQTPPNPWWFAGGNVENTGATVSPAGPQQLNVVTAPTLTVKWTFSTVGAISATPTVEPSGVYVTDWANMLYKINLNTGTLIWSNPIAHYTDSGPPNGILGSRSSPAIGSQGDIVLGDINSTTVFAVNRTTGALIWKTVVEPGPSGFIHGSPVIYNGIVYVSVSSGQEGSRTGVYVVPTFRGSVVALSETTGDILWQFYTAPAGYTGAAIWNAQPVVFPQANALIVATGNNYSVPASVATCVLNADGNLSLENGCLDPADHIDSVVSLNLTTGSLNWSRKFEAADTVLANCETGGDAPPGVCQPPIGADADFASAPNLAAVPDFVGVPDDRGGLSQGYLLGVGQKTGVYWGINPYNGGLYWGRMVGNGQIKGGTAINTGDQVALVALFNAQHLSNMLAGSATVPPYNWDASSWGAINLKTGRIIWQLQAFGNDRTNPANGSSTPGAISVSNQVAFAASSSGYMVAFNAMTGSILWSYNTGANLESAPAIFNDTLYWGAGYRSSTTASKLYAFSIASTAVTARAGGQ